LHRYDQEAGSQKLGCDIGGLLYEEPDAREPAVGGL